MQRSIALCVAGALVATMLAGCSRPNATSAGDLEAAGKTRLDLQTVTAPRLQPPQIDVTVGIAKLQTPAAKAARAKAAAVSYVRGPRPAGVLADVDVRTGDRVKKGQVIAHFDDRMLELGVAEARAGYRKALATANTMKNNAGELRDQRSQVLDARATLVDQQGKLATQKRALEAQLAQLEAKLPLLRKGVAQLRAARVDLRKKLADAEKLRAMPTPPPGIDAAIAGLKGALAQVDGKLAMLEPTLAKVQAAVPQIQVGLAKMAAGQNAMSDARAKIASGLSQMADGIGQLENASSVMRTAADAQRHGVDIARAALGQATLRAPATGVVVKAMPAGQVAMVGAPVVVIQPDSEVLVDIYLAPSEVSRVKPGDSAQVAVDSLASPVSGRVKSVGTKVEFPPTNYPTRIVHFANAVKVTVAVPPGSLPPGVPCDVTVHPSR